MASLSKEEIALGVSLKKMWEWQLKEENFKAIQESFPELKTLTTQDRKGFFEALKGLKPAQREKVDRFSRKKIVEEHPEWIEEALFEKALESRLLAFDPSGRATSEDLPEDPALLARLTRAPLRGEEGLEPEALEAQKSLEMQSVDGEHFFRFQVIDRDPNFQILTFREANERGILDDLLEKRLQEVYPTLRAKEASRFKDGKGQWKPFEEVQEAVGSLYFIAAIEALDRSLESLVKSDLDSEKKLSHFYPQYRFYPFMASVQKGVRYQLEPSPFIQEEDPQLSSGGLSPKTPLERQWQLIKESRAVKKSVRDPYFGPELFSMVEKSWSEISHRAGGVLSFFELKQKSVPSGAFNQEMVEGQTLLGEEAKRLQMKQLIERVKEKKAIHLDNTDAQRA